MGDVVAFRRRSRPAARTTRRSQQPPTSLQIGPGRGEPLWRVVVGDVLRDARARRGETQREVAERAGISVQYLSEIERGRKDPSSEMLAAVGGALDLHLLDLTHEVGRRIAGKGRPTGPVALAA